MTHTTLRNATLQDLAATLKEQADARFDVVAHSGNLSFRGGNLIIQGADAVITEEGVTSVETHLRPTDIFDEGVSNRLDIPRKYLRKMRDLGKAALAGEQPDSAIADLLDHNVNVWLSGSDKQWFIRGFKADDASEGIARAFLSDRFNVIDNYDVLLSVLSGVKEAGLEVDITTCDLSERRMRVRITAPEIRALAPTLLRNYRSPFTGQSGAENPVVFAGIDIGNSETGGGAFTITPVITALVCKNGMTITKEALRKVHLGSRMDEGVIRWSEQTKQANVDLVKAQTADAVRTFLDVEYVSAKIAEMEAKATCEVGEPTKVIEKVSRQFSFTEEESEGILGHFIRGGDVSAGGVLHAITSFAQVVADPDRAQDIEATALDALDFACSLTAQG
jgi:hypothetical protein